MSFIDWIKGKLGIGKKEVPRIEAPENRESINRGKFTENVENYPYSQTEERDRQIRVAKELIGANVNLFGDDLQVYLMKILKGKDYPKDKSQLAIALTDLDMETLRKIHNTARNNSEVKEYLQGMDIEAKDERILSLVNQMEEEAKQEAGKNGYTEDRAKGWLPSVNISIDKLKEKERQEREEYQKEEEGKENRSL